MDSEKDSVSESDARPDDEKPKTTEDPAESGEPSPETPESDGDQDPEAEPSTTSDEDPEASEPSDDAGEPAAAKAGADKGEDAAARKRRRRHQSAQNRISQLTADKRALERKVARFEAQAKTSAVQPPDEHDFDDPAAFQVAVATYAADAAANKTRQEDARNAAVDAVDTRNMIFLERVEAAKDRMPDFEEVFHDRLPVTEAMADVIAESEKGPELAYYLGKNQTELREIANMPPIQAARALGQLEGRLTRSGAKKRSTAPKPVKKVTGKSDVAEPALEDLSMEQYRERRGYSPIG